jgi:hypothetical protein
MADDVPDEVFDERSLHVHQAVGMIAVQANCDVEEAFGRLAIRAKAMGQTVEDTALDVLDGLVRFDDPTT